MTDKSYMDVKREMMGLTKEKKYNTLYLDMAERVSKMSHCERLKVGAIIEKDGRVISMGWNGTPSGMDNCCEENNITKPEVLHAEANALMKLARSHESGEGANLYLTHAPCMNCAKLIHQAGIENIFFKQNYRSNEGIDFLKQVGHNVWKRS